MRIKEVNKDLDLKGDDESSIDDIDELFDDEDLDSVKPN